jgi:hypothetical protein
MGVFNTWTRGGHKYLYETKTAMTNTPTPSATFCHKGHDEFALNELLGVNELSGVNELLGVNELSGVNELLGVNELSGLIELRGADSIYSMFRF